MADSDKNSLHQQQQQQQQQHQILSKNAKGDTKKSEKISNNVVSSPPRSKSSPEIEYELVPPDGGWGWLILGGSMLVNILIPGTIKSFGVLQVEFLDAFKADEAKAAWIPALCYFLYSSLGPVSSILSVRYSYRTVTLIGGTLAALGMMLSYWASSVTYLYISYGVFVGAGAGLSFPPTVYIVTSYFVRLRGLANGLCISGSAFGSIILPPLLRFLLDEYDYRGAVLIMGGITLNVWIAAIFYEPVENHMIRVPKKQNILENIEEEDAGIILKFEDETNDVNAELKSMITSDENLKVGGSRIMGSPDMTLLSNGNENNFVRSASAAVVQNFAKTDDIHQRIRKISTPVKIPHRNQTFTGQLSSTSSLYAVPEGGMSQNRLSRLNMMRVSRNRLSKRSPSTSSFQYVSTPYHGSTLSFQPKEFSSHLSLRSVSSVAKFNEKDKIQQEEKTDSNKRKFFDLSLLKDPIYLIILISNSTNAISYTNFVILLPLYGNNDLHFSRDLSAYLISIVSTTDLIGRIGGSALSDVGFIPKTWYFVGGLALSGVSLFILPFMETYTSLSICCAIFGLASGVYVGITAVIMADLLGTERIESSYGISLFVNGILQLIGPPICGVWYVNTRSYKLLFSTLGVILLAGSALWIFMPFIKKRKSKKNSTPENALLES